jgi:hypothetical protein
MNRLTCTATIIYNEENFISAMDIIKDLVEFSENINISEKIKEDSSICCISAFDNIIKLYLPIHYMGNDAAKLADDLLSLADGYYMDKAFESNEYSRTARYKGEEFYYDCFPEFFTSEKLQHLNAAKDMMVKAEDATEIIKTLSEDYSYLISCESDCNIEDRLSLFFLKIKNFKESFSQEDMIYIDKSISDESEKISLGYNSEETEI